MNRRILAGVILVALAGCEGDASQPPSQSNLASFAFKRLHVGMSLQDAVRQRIVRSCERREEDVACELVDQRLGTVDLTELRPLASFAADGFGSLYLTFNQDAEFANALRALTTAYGDSCQSDGDHFVWCFRDGRLELERFLPDNRNISRLTFYRDRPRPPEPRFTPNSL